MLLSSRRSSTKKKCLADRSWRQMKAVAAATIEALEMRRLLTSLIVSSAADTAVDDSTINGPTISLREAVNYENANGGGTISFAPSLTTNGPATITLAASGDGTAGPSDLAIDSNITIDGPTGSNGITIANSGAQRLFYIGTQSSLTLENLTLSGGDAVGGNSTVGGAAAGLGGAIFNVGTLAILQSTLESNTAQGGSDTGNSAGGGGLGGDGVSDFPDGGGPNGGTDVHAAGFGGGGSGSGDAGDDGGFGGGGGDSGVGGFGGGGGRGDELAGFGGGNGDAANGGAGAGFGGAIFNYGGSVTLTNSTLSNNTALGGTGASNGQGLGGAIFNLNGSVTSDDSTLANNEAPSGGGAIYDRYSDPSTVGSQTGGPSLPNTFPLATVNNSILAESNNGSGTLVADFDDSSNTGSNSANTAGTNNLIETGSASFTPTAGAPATLNGDPKLVGTAPANNGGPTPTFALSSGSSAIGAGSAAVDQSAGITTDQRGAPRYDPPTLGAFAPGIPDSLIVNTTADLSAGTGPANSLREAIDYADSLGGTQTVTFASSLTSGGPATITLTGGNLDITGSVTITGPGANELTIDGDKTAQIVVYSSSQAKQNVAVTGLTITDAPGAIDNSENLTLSSDDISNNTGPGVTNESGAALTSSADSFVGNVESQYGGGGISNFGTLYSSNDTFSGNSSPNGGGIYSEGTGTLTDDTITQNQAIASFPSTGYAGGVYVLTGTFTIANTIVAGNTADEGSPDVNGAFTSQGHNLIGDGAGGTGFVGSDQVGTSASPINPLLGTLANNGGPTPTIAELTGSPAINAGSNALAVDANGKPLTTDQRGPGYPRIVGGTVDIGAFEVQTVIGTPTANSQTVNVPFNTPTPITLTGSDPDAPPLSLTYSVATGPADGTLSGTAPNLTYTPNAGYFGPDSFTFTDSNGTNTSAPATVSINVIDQSVITGTALPSTASVGTPIADKATVTGNNPTGTVTFKLYANPTATGPAIFSDTETLSGGIATSASYIPTAANTFYWVATYNGDTNNSKASTGDAAQPVTITTLTPKITDVAKPATATVGDKIADKATVSGGYNPAGTVTFDLYDNAKAKGKPLFTDVETLVNGKATSSKFKTTTAGTDYWVATYDGDNNNVSVSTGKAATPVVISSPIAAPTANSQTVAVNENTPTAITLTGTDPNTPPLPLTYTVTANPTQGTLSGTAPNLTYTPTTGYTGPDSFQFTVNNGTDTSSPATVTINVSAVAPAGSLSGSSATAATSYNLTALGTSDWAAYGVGGNVGDFVHKATGGSQISNFAEVGSATFGAFVDPNRALSWSDGTPTASASDDQGFAWVNNGLNAGFTFTAPADATTRTLYLYVGGFSSGATLTAHLSNSSAPDYTASYSGSGKYNELVTITYSTTSPDQQLILTYEKTSNINGANGSADLMAAWLGGAPASAQPQVTTNPKSQAVTVGTDVQFTAAATGSPAPTIQWYISTDGGKTFVGYAGGITNTIDIGPATLADSGNEYEAVFTNSAGTATTSVATLTVTPVGTSAGSLDGTFSTAAASYNLTTLGTIDWAHFGTGGSATGFDHKSTGGSQISNVTQVGSGTFGGFNDPNRSVSWTDGTPDATDAGDEGFLWANNGIGAGYSFTAPADTTTRTIYVYLGGFSSGATLTAHLSDGSAADYVASFSNSGKYNDVVAITYKAASAGQQLVLTYVKSQNINGASGSADLMAAWMD